MLRKYNRAFRLLIALVWFANGLFCKVLNFVPRHNLIVQRILGSGYSDVFTLLIGLGEVFIGIWVLTGYKTRLNMYVQISLVVVMNILEFFLVPDLLLWGPLNSLFALMFIITVYFVEKNNPLKNLGIKPEVKE